MMLLALSLRFLDVALLVGERLVGIPLRGNHGIGNLHVHEVDGRHRDAGVVVIERLLDELLGAPRDLRARPAHQHLVELAAPHDLANGRLAHLAQGGIRVIHLEQLFLRIGVLVLHREVQVHEIHIGGQHPLLVVRGVHVRDVHLGDRLDRPRPAPAPAFLPDVDELAEAQNDTALGRFDLEKAAGQPQAATTSPISSRSEPPSPPLPPGRSSDSSLRCQPLRRSSRSGPPPWPGRRPQGLF